MLTSLLRLIATSVCMGAVAGGTSCESRPATRGEKSRPATQAADLSVESAKRDAAEDLKLGRERIFIAGTIASGEVGVTSDDRPFVASLPRSNSLPIGCTVEFAGQAIEYAETYNRAVVAAHRAKQQPVK